MYFTPEDFFYVFIRLLSQVFIRDAPGISEKDENRSKSTKVTKVTPGALRRLTWGGHFLTEGTTSTGKVLVISCITLCKININSKRPL